MQDLIGRVTARTGLDEDVAERAIGIMLSLIQTHGDQSKVGTLFDKMPGASEISAQHGGNDTREGGLFGMLGGGSLGVQLAAAAKFQAAGLNMVQIKELGAEVFDYAQQKAGEELVRDVVNSIPGLNKYL